MSERTRVSHAYGNSPFYSRGIEPRTVRVRPRERGNWLLWIPVVVPLLVPLYNRTEPRLLGFPFYYWCQLGFVGLAMLVTTIVRLLNRRGR
jgi:hypothetical protein